MIEPKQNPQTYNDILSEQRGKNTGRLYRAESNKYVTGELSRIVQRMRKEITESKPEKIPLVDTEAVKTQAGVYLQACENSGTLPTVGGFARCLGYSYEATRRFRRAHAGHPTAKFLEQYTDMCSDALAESALRGWTNPIVSIFLEKACYGLEDRITIQPVQPDPLGDPKSAEEIYEKYRNMLPELDE